MPQRAAQPSAPSVPPGKKYFPNKLLGLSACALSLGGFLLFLPNDQHASLPAPPPLNRREAERGVVRTVSVPEDSLAFGDSAQAERSPVYKPFSGDGLNHSNTSSQRSTTASKAAPIRTTFVNGQIASKHLPKGKKRKSATAKTSGNSTFLNTASDKLTQVTSWLRPNDAHEPPPIRPSAHVTSPTTTLKYPPTHGISRIGLTQSWRNNTKHLLSFGSPAELHPKQGVQLDDHRCLAPISCANPPYFSNDASELLLPRLNLAIFRRSTKRGPLLASRPPQQGDVLAGQGQPLDQYVRNRVLTTPQKGLFWALCPMASTQIPSPLVNAYGELAGVVLGASPSYRGHNCFLVADTSLLYAWLHDQDGTDDSFYDLNYATDKRLMQALTKHPSAPIGRSKETNVLARPGKSLGKIKLGTTRKQIVDFLGEGRISSRDLLNRALDDSDAMFAYLIYDTYGIALNFYDDRLVAIETIEAQYHTPFGLGVGVDFEYSKFSHELSHRACRGYSEQGTPLVAIPGLEVELDNKGIVALMRITI